MAKNDRSMPTWLRAIFHFGIGVQIFPFQWWPLLRLQNWSDQWGKCIVITIGPIDITINSDWGPSGPRGGAK